MKTNLFLTLIGLFAAGHVIAQSPYVFDAERWARLKTSGGTARYMALGGAGVALGADMGAAQVNPAGLGLCRKSQFSFSPDFGSNSTDATYLDQTQRDSKGSFGLDNIGVVFCGKKSDETTDEWKGGSFAVNVTRLSTFHNRISFKGVSPNSSMVDFLVDNSYYDSPAYDEEGNPLNLSGLAYQAFLTDSDTTTGDYKSYLNDDVVQQEDYVTTKGRIWQMDFAYGANYMDKIYMGAAVGLTNLRYEYDRRYEETVGFMFNNKFQAAADTLDYFIINDYVKTTGTGINFKLGLIAKPSDAFRIGVNLQTPTYYYSMRDNYKTSLEANFDGSVVYGPNGSQYTLGYYNESTPEGEFRYTYTAPARASIGAAAFLEKNGFVTAEIEYIPYHMASFSTTDADRSYFNETNQAIRNTYEGVFNYKAGAEVRVSTVKFRGGVNVISDPYKVQGVNKQHLYQFSTGLGFKLNTMTIDLAVVHSRTNSVYSPYGSYTGTPPEASLKNRSTNFVITTGFFFD